MFNSNLENQLIIVDIVDAMQDYVSIQIDIDETKVKAASIIAQNVDLKRIIKKENLDRCIDPQDTTDDELREMIIAPLCYFTYSRLLKGFQGTFTDGGFSTDAEADTRNLAKSQANEMSSIAETLLIDVVEWLQVEDPQAEVDDARINPRVRVIGGEENRASN